ncbi:MAG: hypothetical protein WAK93_21550 [Solirubrobacteraceae bacterium]
MRTRLLIIITAVALCATAALAQAGTPKHSHPGASSSLPAGARSLGKAHG